MPRRNDDRTLGFNMTPMIDVVFLLIIFFLISSHLTRQEKQVKLQLPIATTGAHPAEMKEARLVINLLGDGRILINEVEVAAGSLGARIAATLARVPVNERADFEIRVRSSRDTPYKFVQPIMNACVKQGVWNITYAVNRPEDARG